MNAAETYSYPPEANVKIDYLIKCGVAPRVIKRQLTEEQLVQFNPSSKNFYSKLHRHKKRMKMTKCTMTIEDFEQFLETNTKTYDEEGYGIRDSNVVTMGENDVEVKFLATGSKQIQILAEKTDKWVLGIDGTYNLNVEGKFIVNYAISANS